MPDPATSTTTTSTSAGDLGPGPAMTEATTTTTVKPGHQTTEFYLSVLVALLGAFMASGLVADGSTAMRIAGMAMATLASLGYTASRASVKKAA